MTNMPTTGQGRMDAAAIASQARQLRERYPDLFEHLTERDRALEQTMTSLGPGIDDLCELVVPEPVTHLGLTEEAIIEG